MPLPTEKSSPTVTPGTAKMLVYGPPGVGKTTLGASLNPDHTLILATEPGTGGLEAFIQPIPDWPSFLRAGKELMAGGHPFKQVVIDTADELQRMCQEHVIAVYNEGKPPTHHITHPSDLEYGKGWDALSREWRRIAGFVQGFGGGVMFTSHAKTEKVEKPVGSIDKTVPSLTGAAAKWLLGYVEFVFLMERATVPEHGEVRVIRSAPSELWVAKRRVLRPMPDPLVVEFPDDPAGAAKALRRAMYEATKPQELIDADAQAAAAEEKPKEKAAAKKPAAKKTEPEAAPA